MSVPEHFYVQSAVIPLRRRKGRIEVMLITSRKRKRWVIPKGVKEPELSKVDSAVKEAWEEAGIEGDVSKTPVGSYEYPKWKGVCSVEVFAMKVRKVHSTWPEEYRDRKWLSVKRALQRVEEDDLRRIILAAATSF